MNTTPKDILQTWLARQLDPDAHAWLQEHASRIEKDFNRRDLYLAVGLAPRKLGKADLELTADDMEDARQARAGWDPSGLSVDGAGRILLLLSVPDGEFATAFAELCRTAEVSELAAFYRGLPFYPMPQSLVAQACEGLRSNMRVVFEAVAHRSPYPAEQFTQDQWNQMVLKALFIESPLHLVQQLDERGNPELARILCDYAHERRAASRPVPVELWRCVGPHADDAMLIDIAQPLREGTSLERKSAALSLSRCPSPRAAGLLAEDEQLSSDIREGRLNWDLVVEELSRQTR